MPKHLPYHACIMFVDVSLAKANHVAKPNVSVRRVPTDVYTGRYDSLEAIFVTIHHTHEQNISPPT